MEFGIEFVKMLKQIRSTVGQNMGITGLYGSCERNYVFQLKTRQG